VNAQEGQVAWSIFDTRIDGIMRQFDDYTQALSAGAVIEAADVDELAHRTGLPIEPLRRTLAEIERLADAGEADSWGRCFSDGQKLRAPYRAAKVTGALFHTQGGLVVDGDARVLRADGTPFPNLFAGGGAARGVSGPDATGYIAGNGLLTATTFGKLAGRAAAELRP
jgi:fumarate reductase flavoprotein subunit